MTIHKSYPFKTQNKIYETNPSISHPAKQPEVEMHAPLMDEQFRQYLQYRSLEYRGQPEANPEALDDLEGMLGDLNEYGTEYFPSSETEKAPADEKSPAETKKERLALRKELDQVKTEIRKAGLDPETEKGFIDRLTELFVRIADKQNPADPEEIRAELSVIQEDLKTTVDEKKATDQQNAKDLKDFKNEVEDAKREFKKSVESNQKLTPALQAALIQDFKTKAEALANGKDVEKARQDLADLVTDMNLQVDTSVDETEGEQKTLRDALYKELSGFTQASRFRETQGHWWQKGIELGEKFLSALQTNNWDGFRTHLSKLEGNQRWVCVMRVVTAIYRSAGKNEEKAIQMLNHFVPKDVVQALHDSVMSEPQNMDWGNGDKNECGPEGLVEWNIPTTADFLSRSLNARKDVDPYEVNKTAS